MMTEDDLKAAQELFRRRKMEPTLGRLRGAGPERALGGRYLTFKVKESDRTGAVVEANKHVRLAKEDGAEMYKLALAVSPSA